jgi:glycosyltransferase involved in cell wall biosynthesis/GT2 family glycosyltransferase/FMN phosphatase YigB (HAD superfamily)
MKSSLQLAGKALFIARKHGFNYLLDKVIERKLPQARKTVDLLRNHGLAYVINKRMRNGYPQIKYNIESVTHIEGDKFRIEGWAFRPNGCLSFDHPSGLSFKCTRSDRVVISYHARPDVQKAFPKLPVPLMAGFVIEFEHRRQSATIKISSPYEALSTKIKLKRKAPIPAKQVDLYAFYKALNSTSRKKLLTLAQSSELNLVDKQKLPLFEAYKTQLADSAAYSFDLFDTLVERSVPIPEDVFSALALEISDLWNSKLDFLETRKSCELDARRNSSYQEITIKEIYDEISNRVGFNCELILQRELEIEKKQIIVKQSGLECYILARATGKPIAIISDTYFPADFISDILIACGYADWNFLLVSSELRKTKHHGSLYDELKTRFAVAPERILHLGDNQHSDIKMATLAKINALHVKKTSEIWDGMVVSRWVSSANNTIHEKMVLGALINEFGKAPYCVRAPDKNSWLGNPQLLGYATLGPVLLGFTLWLREQLNNRASDSVCAFLSRDGYFLKHAYDAVRRIDQSLPRSTYLAASRQLCMGSGTISFGDILRIARVDHFPMSLTDFLVARFGFNTAEIKAIPQESFVKSGFVNAHEIVTPRSEKIEKFLLSIQDTILARMEVRRNEYLGYLNKSGIDDCAVLVDLGYSGTAQHEISRLTNSRLHAFYFVTNEGARKLEGHGLTHDAWLVKHTSSSNPFFKHVQLWELLLSATHGSIIGVSDAGDLVKDATSVPDGQTTIALSLIRKGALDFVDHVLHRYGEDTLNWKLDPEFCTAGLTNFFRNPCAEDIALFKNHRFEDKFGGGSRPLLIATPDLEDRSVWEEGSRALSSGVPYTIYDQLSIDVGHFEDQLTLPSFMSVHFKTLINDNGMPRNLVSRLQGFKIVLPYHGQNLQSVQDFIQRVADLSGPTLDIVIANFTDENISLGSLIATHIISKKFTSFDGFVDYLNSDIEVEWWFIASGTEVFNDVAALELQVAIRRNPQAAIITFDYDFIDQNGRADHPYFTPEYSPHLLLATPYIGSAFVISRHGLIDTPIDPTLFMDQWPWAIKSWSLLWQTTWGRDPDKIIRIPSILASVPHSQPNEEAWSAIRSAALTFARTAYSRIGISCEVGIPEWADVERKIVCLPIFSDEGPSVAIIIPTKNSCDIVKTCIESIFKQTAYKNYKIYLIDNDSDDRCSLDYFKELEMRGVKVLRISSPPEGFSYSYVNNRAAEIATEELLLFLNNDTEIISENWLSQLVGWCGLPSVGSVGALLYFPQNLVQHAGITHKLQWGRLPAPSFKLLPKGDAGFQHFINLPRDSAAQTAACMLTPRNLFFKFGMFDDENFKVAYNDCDYGFKLAQAGLFNVYCPDAKLFHYEGLTRGRGVCNDKISEEAAFMRKYQGWVDPFYNPNLTHKDTNFTYMPTVRSTAFPRRKRLAVGTHNLNLEGAPLVIFELVRGLLATSEYEIIVFSLQDGFLKERYEEMGCRVCILRRPDEVFAADPETYRPALSELAVEVYGCDAVLANTVLSWWLIEAATLVSIPAIWVIHESEPPFTHLVSRGVDVNRAVAALSYSYRVIFGSRSTLDVYSEFELVNNFFVLYNGFDYSTYSDKRQAVVAQRDEVRASHGCQSDTLMFILPATVCERKGQIDLINATQYLDDALLSRLRFVIIGDVPSAYSDMLHAAIQKLDPAQRACISVLPITDQLIKYYVAADTMLLTSRMESFPKVIQEALFFDLPIITTPVNGIVEQVRNEVSAIFYSPGDSKDLARQITRLATDAGLREKLSNNAKESLRLLPTIEEMVAEYNNLINEACISSPVTI